MNHDLSFGRWLKQRRKELDLTQDDLARRVGCALITIQKIEAGTRRPSMQISQRLAIQLEIASEERPAFLSWARKVASADRLTVTDAHASWRLRARLDSKLPTPLTPLIGRDHEVAAVRALLLRDDVRLVTLTGAPGIGKTRLGIQAASELECAFAYEVRFAALAPIQEPDLVAAAIAQALGVQQTGHCPFWEILKKELRGEQILLLLDNFEQVLKAAPLLAELLTNCPQLKLLVTSRARLHLSGEHEFNVPPLALPDPARLPAVRQLRRYAAITLFVYHAQAVSIDFALTAENAQIVAAICAHLDGLPLAIQLAAARSKLFSPQSLLHRLSDRLALLTSGPQDLPSRQQTLRDAIAWSYDLLEESERILLRRLAAFVGGCNLAAMEAVCNAAGDLAIAVLDGVASLVDKSLLLANMGRDAEPHFRMLETIREYGLEQLEASGEADFVRHQHAAYYLQLAETAEAEIQSEQQIAWLALLTCEHDNLRAALQWAVDTGNAEMAARIASALQPFWQTRGHGIEGRRWLALALEHSSGLPIALRAKVLRAAGAQAGNQGDRDIARSYFEASLQLYRALEDTHGMAAILGNLGRISFSEGDRVQASRFFTESLSISYQFRYKRLIAIGLNDLGYLQLDQGAYDSARRSFDESLALMREIRNARGMANVLHSLGVIACTQGDYQQAKNCFVESLQLSQEVRFVQITIACLKGLAGVAGAQGQLERAARLYGAVQALMGTTGVKLLDSIAHTIFERTMIMVHARLDATRFAALWDEGRAMSLEDAIAEALCVES